MHSSMYAPEDGAAAGGAARRLAMQHLYRYVRRGQQRPPLQIYKVVLHTYADVSIRMHTSAYVSIRQDSSGRPCGSTKSSFASIHQHTSAYVSSIRQHTSGQQRAPLQIYKVVLHTYAADVC
jgi:hypothetical protein